MRHVTLADDRYGMLKDIGNSSHRPLLLLALEKTRGSHHPVLEMGMGHGSTPYLHNYCTGEKRMLKSFDHVEEWAAKFGMLGNSRHEIQSTPWENDIPMTKNAWSVALVDHAPEERRHVDIAMLAKRAAIVVIHDSEDRSPGYQLDKIWHLFKYRVDICVPAPYSNATAVSNFIDLSSWRGTTFEGYDYAVE
jgi:hypothetical protein